MPTLGLTDNRKVGPPVTQVEDRMCRCLSLRAVQSSLPFPIFNVNFWGLGLHSLTVFIDIVG